MNTKHTSEIVRAICVERLSLSEAAMALKRSEAELEKTLLGLEKSEKIPRGKLWSLLDESQTKKFGK